MTHVSGHWLSCPETQAVFDVFQRLNKGIWVVGGCVRNALLDQPVSDIDMATQAHPDEVMSIAKDQNWRAIPTGIDHGTITVVIGHVPFEITTLRRDVDTDGRYAKVLFSEAPEDDAKRRDFTINALFADQTGIVHDYVGGLPDIEARRVRFIGNAEQRIKEDYLRILRFFRFHAWYGADETGLDTEASNAIARGVNGLSKLSKERVTSELVKLFSAPDPSMAVSGLAITGCAQQLLGAYDHASFCKMIHWQSQFELAHEPLSRLLAFAYSSDLSACRWSKLQSRYLSDLRDIVNGNRPAHALGHEYGVETASQGLVLRSALLESHPKPAEFESVRIGAAAEFPVTASDLMPDFTGLALGQKLADLKSKWIDAKFALSRDELLKHD